MIISASYKTDIPAFYGPWFINRLKAGFCMMTNPYNRKGIRVDLSNEAVDGIVFWTKNVGPFVERLNLVHDLEYPFIIQYTINGYPRSLEFSVVETSRSIDHMKCLADAYGQAPLVWRYDTVVVSSDTPIDFHRRNFEKLARGLQSTTDEVVISFAQIYKKTLHNLNWAAAKFGFTWEDPDDETKFNLSAELAQIAKSYGMQLKMCSQRQFLAPGVEDARCVDAERLSRISRRPIAASLKGNRPDCGCFASRDIGEYDTCPHGCVYCYAVRNRELAQRRYKEHNPESEYLFEPAHHDSQTPTDENLLIPVQLHLLEAVDE